MRIIGLCTRQRFLEVMVWMPLCTLSVSSRIRLVWKEGSKTFLHAAQDYNGTSLKIHRCRAQKADDDTDAEFMSR